MNTNPTTEELLNGFNDKRKSKKKIAQTKFTTSLNVIIPEDEIFLLYKTIL